MQATETSGVILTGAPEFPSPGGRQKWFSSDSGDRARGRLFVAAFLAPSTVRRALRVALVVGPILGLINHFDLFLGEPVTIMRVVKICVTFVVPYCVSAYSSATTMLAQRG